MLKNISGRLTELGRTSALTSILDQDDQTTYDDPSPKGAAVTVTLLWEGAQWLPLSMETFQWRY